jgi:hypothetical protein
MEKCIHKLPPTILNFFHCDLSKIILNTWCVALLCLHLFVVDGELAGKAIADVEKQALKIKKIQSVNYELLVSHVLFY